MNKWLARAILVGLVGLLLIPASFVDVYLANSMLWGGQHLTLASAIIQTLVVLGGIMAGIFAALLAVAGIVWLVGEAKG